MACWCTYLPIILDVFVHHVPLMCTTSMLADGEFDPKECHEACLQRTSISAPMPQYKGYCRSFQMYAAVTKFANGISYPAHSTAVFLVPAISQPTVLAKLYINHCYVLQSSHVMTFIMRIFVYMRAATATVVAIMQPTTVRTW